MEDFKIKPAIVVVGYSRAGDLRRLLDSVNDAEYKYGEVTLVISLDQSSKAEEVQKVASEFCWEHGEKIIRTFPERQGLRSHILQCGDLSEKYGAVIILEDDLVVSRQFYTWTYEAVNFYKDVSGIAGVALYSHCWNGYAQRSFQPVNNGYSNYFGQFSITWGQCWTFEQWRKFRVWYGTHDGELVYQKRIPDNIYAWPSTSWGKYFVNYIVDSDLYYVMPYVALSTNYSDVGEHCLVPSPAHQVPLQEGQPHYIFAPIDESSLKYDVFFERMGLEQHLKDSINIQDGLCVSLYGNKKKYDTCRYFLTTQILDYKIVERFGCEIRPHEMNVIRHIQGDSIFLYDTFTFEKNRTDHKRHRMQLVKYEVCDLPWRDALFYSLYHIRLRFTQWLGSKFGKKKNTQ